MSASNHLREVRDHLSAARRDTSDPDVAQLIGNIESGLEAAPSIVEDVRPMQSRNLIRLEHHLDQIVERASTDDVERRLRTARDHIREARDAIEANLRRPDE